MIIIRFRPWHALRQLPTKMEILPIQIYVPIGLSIQLVHSKNKAILLILCGKNIR